MQLFFIMSAFTLFHSHDKRKNELHEKRNFIIRRFFRIAPMYYVGIIYYTLTFIPNFWSDYKPSAGAVISNIVFVHGISPYWFNSVVPGGWSITDEMVFYCFVPLLVSQITSIRKAIIFTAVSLAASSLLYLLLAHAAISNKDLWEKFLYYYFPCQLPVFGFGIITYHWIKNNYVNRTDIYLAMLIPLILIVMRFGLKISVDIVAFLYFSIGFVILVYVISKGRLNFLVNKLLVFIEKLSFSLYVVHFAILSLIQTLVFHKLSYVNNFQNVFEIFLYEFVSVV